MITILLLFKRYSGDMPLHNEFARLDRNRFRVIACYLGGESDENNQMEKIADHTYSLNARDGEVRWHNLRLVRRLREIIDREKVHLVNCQLHRTVPLGVAAARGAKQRPLVISTVHGLGGSSSWKRRLQNRLWHSQVFQIVGVSEAVRQDILADNPGLSADKVVTIHNGLRFDVFASHTDRIGVGKAKRRGLRFGTVGRLSAVKNHETLIRAFSRLLVKAPEATLSIAGRGEAEERLKKLTRDLGIEDHVFFLGFRKDIPDTLRQWDAFVFPSLREGLGLALLEAMASGLPVVASRVGGIPEIFPSEPVGVLVDPRDEPGLAEAMLMLVNKTPEERLAWGNNARRRAMEDFSAAGMIEKYQKLYAEAFDTWSRRRVRETVRPKKG